MELQSYQKDGYFGIHGVYYDGEGNIISMDIEPNTYLGSDLDDLRNTLKLMIE